MVYALACSFRSADVEHIDDGASETSHLVLAIETADDSQIDDVLLIVLCVVAIVTGNDTGIA